LERAIWKDNLIEATVVSKDYNKEEAIREASSKGELLCPDEECSCRVLKYCHGDIKEPYFSHKSNVQCDYDFYDRNNSSLIPILHRLHQCFADKNYKFERDVKVFPHHYTHFLFTNDSGKKVALELVSDNISLKVTKDLNRKYDECGVKLRRIVVSDRTAVESEEKIGFIKRHQLNCSPNKDLIIIDKNGERVYQLKEDPNEYVINNKPVSSPNYPKVYSKESLLSDIIFDEENFLIADFFKDYESFLAKKQKQFAKRKEEEEKKPETIGFSLSSLKTELREHYSEIIKNPDWRKKLIKATLIPATGYYICHRIYGYGIIYFTEGTQMDICFEKGVITCLDWNEENKRKNLI